MGGSASAQEWQGGQGGKGGEGLVEARAAVGSSLCGTDGHEKRLLFHTFSNTGWLAYGALLQQLHKRHGREKVDRVIRGCVIDSAPSPQPDPQVGGRCRKAGGMGGCVVRVFKDGCVSR